MATFTCSKCATEWPENYCPACAQTIQRSPTEQSPFVNEPSSVKVITPRAAAKPSTLVLPRRYSYNASWGIILVLSLGLVFFPFCFYWATHNKAGMIIDGVIRLGPTGASLVYCAMAAFFGMMGLLAIVTAARRLKFSPVLELGTDALSFPEDSYRPRMVRIAYADIEAVSVGLKGSTSFIHVTARGDTASISGGCLPDSNTFKEVKDFLKSKVPRWCAAGAAENTVATRLGFSVGSLSETLRSLEAMEATVLSQPAEAPFGRRAVVKDFEGHKVELDEA